MQNLGNQLTLDDFNRVDWQSLISQCEPKTCETYEGVFANAAKHAEDDLSRTVFFVLSRIASFFLDVGVPDSSHANRVAFGPALAFPNGWRTAQPSDLGAGLRKTLLALIPKISDPELRARVADVLWFLKTADYTVALQAIDAYLESAENLGFERGSDRLIRALQLSVQLNAKEKFEVVISHIERWIEKYAAQPSFAPAYLMRWLLIYNQGEPTKYVKLSEKLAEQWSINSDLNDRWSMARRYWGIQAQWYKRMGNKEIVAQIQLRIARSYVTEAKDNIESGDIFRAVWVLRNGIQVLRDAHAPKEEINDAHRLLLECQRKTPHMMQSFQRTFDATQFAHFAQEQVRGKTVREAILTLAQMLPLANVEQLRRFAQEFLRDHPLYAWMSFEYINGAGLTTARRDPNDPIRAQMHIQRANEQLMAVIAIAIPAIHQINKEHRVQLSTLVDLLSENPFFVPPDRVYLYARGLKAGFDFDFAVASHLLVLQLENSIRRWFGARGILVSWIDQGGIQEYMDINKLLYHEQAEQILTPSLAFDLRNLLIERFGNNFRNRLAHGLLDDITAQSPIAVFVWWLTLGLCCLPLMTEITHEDDKGDATAPPS